jgi:hypothetical protein
MEVYSEVFELHHLIFNVFLGARPGNTAFENFVFFGLAGMTLLTEHHLKN